ncbi:hypothetical protein JZ751_014381 [Albula glossodonta]|uniref:Uncharacterized protein n=1 Tax=Albula glossodonta TaxID=121402 RepID=A0A8T2NVT9_9TELE|nr:hypothetical protein JZ751_014381 [Albula glossodonta]
MLARVLAHVLGTFGVLRETLRDLVKSHLMYAVREEVEVLKEQIKELYERNSVLERENAVLKSLANNEQLSQLAVQPGKVLAATPPQPITQQQQQQQQQQPEVPPPQPNVSSAQSREGSAQGAGPGQGVARWGKVGWGDRPPGGERAHKPGEVTPHHGDEPKHGREEGKQILLEERRGGGRGVAVLCCLEVYLASQKKPLESNETNDFNRVNPHPFPIKPDPAVMLPKQITGNSW